MHPSTVPARNLLSRSPRALTARLLTTISLVSGVTFARPEFPSVVEDTVMMGCTPDCTLCHEASPGNGSPLTQPFVTTLADNGFTGQLESLGPTLTQAMAAMPPTDADGDGVGDFDELRGTMIPAGFEQATTNPNVPEVPGAPSADICPIEPVYGCGASHVAPRPHVHGDYLLLGLLGCGLVGLTVSRRLAQRRRG